MTDTMDIGDFINALALIFLMEGMGALFMPDKWWRHLQKEIAEITTGQLRFIGIVLCIGGLLIFLAANE